MNLKGLTKIFALLAFSISTQPVFSQPTVLPFLKLGIGAHAHALGGAYIARVNDASAIAWNPSALVSLQAPQIFLYHNQFIADSSYDYGAYAHPFKNRKASLGLAVANFSKGTFNGRDENRRPTGDFTASDSFVTVAYGRRVGRSLSLGVGVKMIRSQIHSFTSNGIAMDLSSSYQFSAKTRMAFGLFHLGPKMSYVNESVNLPGTFSAGIAHQLFGPINVSGDLRYGIYDQKMNFSLGGELNLGQVASFRMGYLSQAVQQVKNESQSGIGGLGGFGMGIGLKIFKRTDLDYAFVPMGELGGAHHMSLQWRFK